MTHKFVDSTTMTDILNKSVASNMQSLVDELVQQATETDIYTVQEILDLQHRGLNRPFIDELCLANKVQNVV